MSDTKRQKNEKSKTTENMSANVQKSNSKRNVCVIVLGDIGRSPRMQYHVNSLLKHDFNVDLIGYGDTTPISELTQNPRCSIQQLVAFPELNLPNLLKYLFKSIWQMLSLFIALFNIRRPDVILCQNPPGIPTLFVCYVYCALFKRCKFIIDWHNYTYTILSLSDTSTVDDNNTTSINPQRRIVKLAKWFESYFGRKSSYNFCVTKAMQEDLEKRWDIQATVLYDRPPENFHSITLEEKHDLFYRLASEHHEFLPTTLNDDEYQGTLFTYKDAVGVVHLRENRPAILVSSTSWTPDEDFSILLKALDRYEKAAAENRPHYPHLFCIITGKGPQKSAYLGQILKRNFKNVTIVTPWLTSDDYPLCLASADLGVCLHYSSSGLDLPMKVVDMFGCALPVCAVKYKCIDELVKHGKNGFVFDTYLELSQQILTWFYDFPNNATLLSVKEEFSERLREFQSLRWDENWNENALPAFSN